MPHEIIAEDPALIAEFGRAVCIARNGLPLILQGETGTGKELYARAIHGELRPHGPFLAINCAAIPEGLIEAELFGYGDGAFTGGRKGGTAGRIEQAHTGTLLLDEIGDMPLLLQSRLLRVLQERAFTRIGENREIPVDLLVLCATHRRLDELVAEGRFREDLYYRLNGYTLALPPLRDRSDIEALIRRLFELWGAVGGRDPEPLSQIISSSALALLAAHPWPGNIRQLEHVIRVLLALRTPGRVLEIADLPAEVRATAMPAIPAAVEFDGSLEAAEAEIIRRTLDDHHGNVASAARALGISRGTVYRKLRHGGSTLGPLPM